MINGELKALAYLDPSTYTLVFQGGFLLILAISVLLIGVALGLIPANIAQKKGYSFGLWWFYGWMLFIVALIHVCVIPDKNAQQIPINENYNPPYNPTYCPPSNVNQSAADELRKYKELKDRGIITEEEFQAKKEQLLKLI